MSSELLLNLIGESQIKSLERKMKQGRLPDGILPQIISSWFNPRFGEFSGRVLLASEDINNRITQDFTAIGGWCALRTKDSFMLRDGKITDVATGTTKQYQTVAEVSDWLRTAISIDQIVEAIGIYAGCDYAAISEERLWRDRLRQDLQQRLGRKLTEYEDGQLTIALNDAQKIRFAATKRYISFVTGKKDVNLVQVNDWDIYEDLIEVRKAMFDAAGITLDELIAQFPKEKQSIPGYSLVWGMYTGPYLAVLKGKGYVRTKQGVIVEPAANAISETEAKKEVNDRIFANPDNQYGVNGGLNEDLGFASYAEVLEPNGQTIKQTKTINFVPNYCNYIDFLRQLAQDPKSSSLTLNDNPVFMWGVNLLPFGQAKQALIQMVRIKDAYKQEKQTLNNQSFSQQDKQNTLQQQKQQYEKLTAEQAAIIIEQLTKMLSCVFS